MGGYVLVKVYKENAALYCGIIPKIHILLFVKVLFIYRWELYSAIKYDSQLAHYCIVSLDRSRVV